MKRLVSSVQAWRWLVLILALLVKEHALHSTAAEAAGPGVCRETREVEMIHNVTVYQPCVRRLAVPCGRPGNPPRPCTMYAQRTCTYTTSRLQLQNVTGDVCCQGFTEGPHGNCVPDDYIHATGLEHLPSNQDRNQTSSLNITQDQPIELPPTPPKNSSSITPHLISTTTIPLSEEREVLSRPLANSTGELEGGGSLRNSTTPLPVTHPPSNVTTIGQPLLTPHNVTVPMVGPATWGQRSTKQPLLTKTTTVHPEPNTVNASTDASPPPKQVRDNGNTSEDLTSASTVGLVQADNSDDRTTTKTTQGFSTSTTSITTTTTIPSKPQSSGTLSTTSTSTSVSPLTTEKPPAFVGTNEPKEVNSTYNVIQLPIVPKLQDGGSGEESSPAPNGSVVVLQAGTGMIPLLPSAVYVAVTIAAVVIIVTLVCAVYVFILRDKPRTTSTVVATCPQRGVEAGDFLLTESIYATCNGFQSNNVRANGRAALPMPDSSTAEAFRRGLPAILPDEATNGRLLMVPEEPPLTTSTPVMGDKLQRFGYTNPAYNGGESLNGRGVGDTASLSDASDLHEAPVVRDACGDDGYLVPISHRPTPPCTPLSAMKGNGVGPSPNYKIKSCDGEEQASSPLSLSRTGSNSTHTYEEIPAHIGVSPPILSNTAKSLDDIPSSEDACDVIDDISIGDDVITNDEVTGDDTSVDLVTFMTNYLSNSCLAANNNSGSRENYTTPTSDPNATYDRADMYTPATPGVDNTTLTTPPGESELTLNGNRKSPTLETLVNAPSAPYAAAAKVRVKDGVSGISRWDSRRSSSYENIYDTVGPPDGDTNGSEGKEEEEKPEVVVTPALPARRILFQYSPTLPVKSDMDYDVIDLSDNDEDDVKQWTKVVSTNNNVDKAVVNGEQGCTPSVLPPCESEPHYLSLVGDEDGDKATSTGHYQDLRDIVIDVKETEA